MLQRNIFKPSKVDIGMYNLQCTQPNHFNKTNNANENESEGIDTQCHQFLTKIYSHFDKQQNEFWTKTNNFNLLRFRSWNNPINSMRLIEKK